MLHAIVFDFDGVIADSEPLHLEVYQQVLSDRGIALSSDAYYDRYLGYDDVGGFKAVLTDHGRPADDETVRELVEAKARLFPALVDGRNVLFPDAAAVIREFADRLPLAIASGALPHEIELILTAAGIRDAFSVIVGAGQTPRSKPSPDPYARAVELLQERGLVAGGADAAAGCVAIEDSKWGILSAKAAGLACVAVTTSYAADELTDADLVVHRLGELTVDVMKGLVARA